MTVKLISQSFSLGERLSKGVTVNLDRVPERKVWVDWKLTHHGGADATDYSIWPSYFYFAPDRRVQFVIVTARDDDFDDDCESATVRIECAGRSYTSLERAGEDGLIVRTVSQPMCTAGDGRPIEGEMTFEGIDGDGWYWVNGDRNVAVAPLVCEESLRPELRPPVPAGVTARPSGDRRFVLSVRGTWHGTLMVHDETGFMGIVPHLVDLEGAGEHVAPYWKGGGGIVGRPLDGGQATVRLACGEADAESQFRQPPAPAPVSRRCPRRAPAQAPLAL